MIVTSENYITKRDNFNKNFIEENGLVKISLKNSNYEWYDASSWYHDPVSRVVYRISTVFSNKHLYRLRYINGYFLNNFGNIVPENELGYYK